MASNSFFIVLGLLGAAVAYKSGAPVEVCENMTPDHGLAPLTTPLPYTLLIQPASIAPGDKATLTLQGSNGKTFKGFMIEARLGNTIIGTFDANGDAKTIDCPNGVKNAVTHTNPKEKSSVQVTWNAPKDLEEKVTFYVTVAETGSKYWVKQNMGTLTVQ